MEEQFVYIYRDLKGNPVYVGRGKDTGRPLHFAANDTDTLTLAGPFGSEDAAIMVETAVMSAFFQTPKVCGSLTNINRGHEAFRFRSMAIPLNLVDRISLPLLGAADFKSLKSKSGGQS